VDFVVYLLQPLSRRGDSFLIYVDADEQPSQPKRRNPGRAPTTEWIKDYLSR
jgi:hypothetical protein